MNIAITSTNYVDSNICGIVDGLLQLGHQVYNLNGPPINYAQSWPIPSPDKIDIWMMMDTDNSIGLTLTPDNMGSSVRGAKKIICHLHDRWTDYVNVPNSPIKLVPVEQFKCAVSFVRDLDKVTVEKCQERNIPVFPVDYSIEQRYTEATVPHLDTARKKELLFLGTLDTARRQFYLDSVRNAGLPVRYGTYEYNDGDGKWSKHIYGRYTHDPRYYEELCKYMFIFCGFGAGPSTMRVAESYSAGCIPVIQKYPEEIISYHTFEDGINCVLWNTGEELIDKLKYWMSEVEKAEELRQRCYEYGQKFMTSKFLANYILEKIK
jgi:hypothetical protein